MKAYPITVTVNGDRYQRSVEPRLLLSDFLRHELGLTGTHVGCEHGVCGACTVLFDGEPVRSCLMFAVQADGHEIRTVESLGTIDEHASSAEGVPGEARAPVRLLHAGLPDDAGPVARATSCANDDEDPRGDLRQPLPLHGLPEHRRGGQDGSRDGGTCNAG